MEKGGRRGKGSRAKPNRKANNIFNEAIFNNADDNRGRGRGRERGTSRAGGGAKRVVASLCVCVFKIGAAA